MSAELQNVSEIVSADRSVIGCCAYFLLECTASFALVQTAKMSLSIHYIQCDNFQRANEITVFISAPQEYMRKAPCRRPEVPNVLSLVPRAVQMKRRGQMMTTSMELTQIKRSAASALPVQHQVWALR